tara:strand:+ start:685 stop:2328 length:1644 start_codon:yes stop_codon:yes gene_type:complete
MILEALGLGMLFPVVKLILNPDIMNSYPLVADFFLGYGLDEHFKVVIFTMIVFALVYVIKTFFLLYISWVIADYSQGLSAKISNDLFNGYIRQPYINSLNSNSAHLQRNVTNEILQFTAFITNILFLISELSITLSIVITLLFIEPIGAVWVICILTAFSLGLYMLMKNYIFQLGLDRLEYDQKRTFTLIESLNGYKELKLFNKEFFFSNLFNSRNNKYYSAQKKIQLTQQIPRLFIELFGVLGLSFFIVFSVLNGADISNLIAVLSVFLLAAFRLMPSFNRILSNMQSVKYGSVAVNFLFKELVNINLNNEVKNKPEIFFDIKEPIIIDKLSFKYPNTQEYVLENISVKIPFGSFVGIIGESGSGKSTFIDNLIGFLNPNSGEIKIGGKDIHKTPSLWMQNIGYVPQIIYLTDSSLRNNIAFGVEENEIDDERILEVLKEAELLDFVKSLSDGISTNVGQRGAKISGGQRQRIGIARALYNDPKLLIFDEGTSALDSNTEQSIIKSILKFKNKKTIIMIAHREKTISECETILEFNNNKMIVKQNV